MPQWRGCTYLWHPRNGGGFMAPSEAQKRASIKYLEKIRAPKGTKERWKSAATNRGKSLNQFIVDTVETEIQAEKQPGE